MNALTQVRRGEIRVPRILPINEAERREATPMIPWLLLIHSPPCREGKDAMTMRQPGLVPRRKAMCVAAELRSPQSCTVGSRLTILLLMVFRNSFSRARKGSCMGTNGKCAVLNDKEQLSSSAIPNPSPPLL